MATAIDNDISVAAKFTETEIWQKIREQIQNSDDNQIDEKSQFIENPSINAEMKNTLKVLKQSIQYCSCIFQKQCGYEQFIND